MNDDSQKYWNSMYKKEKTTAFKKKLNKKGR